MIAQYAAKFAAESLDYQVDYSLLLTAGDPISTFTVTTTDFSQPFAASLDASKTIVTFWLAGGTAGNTGKVICTATSIAGRIFQIEVNVFVRPL